ncbi:hypothetical protein CC80DRAFT_488275 [Byssothecium circinans]|uniref:F-box domain-containing protein n=1 Tax=Byssothecium circinans TaxID=147558 RepID=A0A6A5UD60_9PLEO|nr:hypothetical protein CC80DRAFT_488275 [Byssothecium circinans]
MRPRKRKNSPSVPESASSEPKKRKTEAVCTPNVMRSRLESLPTEFIRIITAFLPTRDILDLARTCQTTAPPR